MENQVLNNSRPHHAGAGGREDCWSEGATETLVEAWGDRFLKLSRGNLRQKDWKEVADAVNSRQNGLKPSRTGVQCKNRVDTLKKKYKLEKAKPSQSKWPFYSRLDYLIGSSNLTPQSNKRTAGSAATSPSMNKPGSISFTVKSNKLKVNSNPNRNPNSSGLYYSRLNSSESSLGGGSGRGGGGGRDDDDDVLCGGAARRHTMEYVDFSEETAYKELARAILRFGEIYERIESSKQQQMMELEKQRMEFTRDLECQRMNMFMDAQLELEKMKQPVRHASGAGKKL